MNIALLGAELEENLGLSYTASVLETRGHNIAISPFSRAEETIGVVAHVVLSGPDIVGLSKFFSVQADSGITRSLHYR